MQARRKKNKKKKLCVCRLRLHAAAERGCLLVVTPEYDTIGWDMIWSAANAEQDRRGVGLFFFLSLLFFFFPPPLSLSLTLLIFSLMHQL